MRLHSKWTRTQIASPLSIPCVCSVASSHSTTLSRPFFHKQAFDSAVLDEILQERVVSSRNRRNPRGVKRKMSNFPLRPRKPIPGPQIHLKQSIRILK